MKFTFHIGLGVALLAAGVVGHVVLAADGCEGAGCGEPGAPAHAHPGLEDALHRLDRKESIRITSLDGFTPANGVTGGRGTLDDPFVIEGVFAQDLVIRDVEAAVTIRDVYVTGTLLLDWTGEGARVEHSTVGILKTNTNVPHEVPATWADVVGNRIGEVVIRHQGGSLDGNVIGAPGAIDPSNRVLDVQGYNGLLIANNTVHGPAEIRLHGHHHAHDWSAAWMPHDLSSHPEHTDRHVTILVERNVFRDPSGVGLSVSDRNHAANDRTAKSNPDPALEDPHRHFTDVVVRHNRFEHGALRVEQPNAQDERHLEGGLTTITVAGNDVVDPVRGTGILVTNAIDAHILLEDNNVRFTHGLVEGSTGILVQDRSGGNLRIARGTLSNVDHGVEARRVAADSPWEVDGVAYEAVAHPAYWDASVKTRPGGAAPPDGTAGSGGHAHA